MDNYQPIDIKFDKQHIWHPYTSIGDPLPVYGVTHTDKNILYLDDGTALFAGYELYMDNYRYEERNRKVSVKKETYSLILINLKNLKKK